MGNSRRERQYVETLTINSRAALRATAALPSQVGRPWRGRQLSPPMRAYLLLVAALMTGEMALAATNDLSPFRTNFFPGTSLSSLELESVVKLANLSGIQSIVEVSTVRHLAGTTIEVAGDETFEGRSVTSKTLRVHRNGWDTRVRPGDAPSLGEYWAESARPQQQERTIVEIGDRKVRVGLLNGVKPAGADKIIDAFVNGRVRFRADALKRALSEADVKQPTWIGISQGNLWIAFSSPQTRFIFTLDGDQITLLDIVRAYE